MPFVNVRILEGHSQQRKDEMSRRITEAISEVAELPKEAIWVVFEDVTADDWYVGATTVDELKKKEAVTVTSATALSIVGDSSCEKLADGFQFTEGPLWDRARPEPSLQRHPGQPIHAGARRGGVETFRAAEPHGQRPRLRPAGPAASPASTPPAG